MKVYVIARQPIINTTTGALFSDPDLARLNGLHSGPAREVEKLTAQIAYELVDEFEQLHPDFINAEYEIKTNEDSR